MAKKKKMSFVQVLNSEHYPLVLALEKLGNDPRTLDRLIDELFEKTGYRWEKSNRQMDAAQGVSRLVVKESQLDILNRSFLAEAINDSGMTKKAICLAAGINRVSLNNHLIGTSCLSVDYLLKVCQVLVKAPGRPAEK